MSGKAWAKKKKQKGDENVPCKISGVTEIGCLPRDDNRVAKISMLISKMVIRVEEGFRESIYGKNKIL